eukprot:scaffold33552_cov128-Skeletonema_dohrnii-CCMP3373.AAC.5
MAERWYTYCGRDDEVIPPGEIRVRIHESLTVIPARAFKWNRHIEEVECHDGVKTVEKYAFDSCPSLRKVIMRGVKVVKQEAFDDCKALTDVECDKLEFIEVRAFFGCKSLKSINLSSAKIVRNSAFNNCTALTNVEFGKELERIEGLAFYRCKSLERITIPLKDCMIACDGIFQVCNLKHVDLVEGAVLRDTIAALLLEEWRNDMDREMLTINQILPTAPAGDYFYHAGGKGEAQAVRMWMRSVLCKIVRYKAEHRRLLNEAATILQHALPNDIVKKNVLPFLELPSYTFEGED